MKVWGELYEVNQAVLDTLDAMEGVGTERGYFKNTIHVVTDAGETIAAIAYMKNRKSLAQIHSEPLSSYEIDERYVLPNDR